MKYEAPLSSANLYPYLLFPVGPELNASLEQVNNANSSPDGSHTSIKFIYLDERGI